ncbi:hypothetical protein L6164_029701 [Bauhinia variegata]|uniref:Uncharacterized protein n=1 Tax=Bauhinia variegata TaxID=167791 RepID=A0ACB9L9M8_BAUVA|nr:hypothetical protein L6164_029701 [Bauhinia variegata]
MTSKRKMGEHTLIGKEPAAVYESESQAEEKPQISSSFIPHVHGLPLGSETTTEIPSSLRSLLMTAMDLTEPIIELSLQQLKTHLIYSLTSLIGYRHWHAD